jgi:hypothetical protein
LFVFSAFIETLDFFFSQEIRPPRDWEGHAPCAIGASKSIVAHWGLLSMRPCAPCKFWLIILLFHVSISRFLFCVVSVSLSSLVVNFPLLAVPWFSLSMFRTVICVNKSDKRIHSFDSKFSVFKTHLSWRFFLFSE